jgi:hypothetical protein
MKSFNHNCVFVIQTY